MSIYTQSKELHDLSVDYQVSDWMVNVATKYKYFSVDIAPNHCAHLILKMQRSGKYIERVTPMADFHWSIEGWRPVVADHIRAMRTELAESGERGIDAASARKSQIPAAEKVGERA